jgi:antitoxin ParD1/3/4
MGTNVNLTPALEQFARECVENGRYNNVSEVVREGLRLLQEREARIRAFQQSLEDAIEEASREGTYTVEEVMAEVDEIIAKARAKRAAQGR